MDGTDQDAQILVRDALQSQIKGRDNSKYTILMNELKECEDPDRLVVLLTAIAQWASMIADHHDKFKELLSMLFSFDWDIANEFVMSAFESVLISLVSANQGFIDEAFRLLVRNFTREDDAPNVTMTPEEEQLNELRMKHLHSTIQSILRICPLGCGALLNVIIELYPKQGHESRIQCEFTKEALKVGEHVPVLLDRLVRMAIKSLLELDLELASALDEAKANNMPFKMDDVDMAEGDAPSSGKRLRLAKDDLELAEKVDSMLCILFDFFDAYSQQKKPTQLLFRAALDSFEKDVLRTGKARFTQFFIFYLCNARSSYVDAYLNLLLNRLTDEKESLGVRENAAKFLGSFLARAKYVHVKQVKQSLEKLNAWLQAQAPLLLPRQKSTRAGGYSSRKRQLFVSAFQSLIYVFLFRGAQVGGQEFLESLEGWKQLCENHPFSPLGRISEDIREEYFACLGRADVSMMEKTPDNGEDDENTEGVANKAQQQMQITVEFPFDPLELDRSAKKLQDVYQIWYSSVDDELESSDSEEEAREDDIELDYNILNAKLPKPIKIERIRQMLGGAWAHPGHSGSAALATAPPPPSNLQVGTSLLPEGASAALFIPKAGHFPARQRSLSAMSTDSQLAGSW